MNVIAPRLLDSRARWGTLDTSPASPGIWQRIRLTVYPPGITPAERRLLRVCHAWPVAGAILSLFGLVALSDAGPVLSIGLVLTAYVAVWVALSRATAELRSRCRVVTVATEYVGGELHVFGDADLLRSAVSRLRALELDRRSGHVHPVEYELAWGEVYQELPSTSALTRHRI